MRFQEDRTRALPGAPKRRQRSAGGNVIIECALTLVPLLALVFAFADFSLMLFRWSTLQNAVREGCRYAITFQSSGALGQDASIVQVVQNYALGVVSATDSPQHIFVNYYAPTDLANPIQTGGNIPGNVVQVSVQNVSWAWIAPLSGSFAGNGLYTTTPFALSVYSSDMLGGYPAGVNSVKR